jgi:uncharacterized membrane protein YraQ (UPF0718 family)
MGPDQTLARHDRIDDVADHLVAHSGFTLSAIIESLVRKSTISRLLPDDRPRSLVTAAGLGAASSSCSYAAVALARSLVRKGADFTAALRSPSRVRTSSSS